MKATAWEILIPRKTLLFGVSLIAVHSGACTFSAESDGPVSEPAIDAPDLNAFWAAHVAHRQKGDVDAATSVLAEDCVLFEPFQPPVSGLENIAAKMKEARARTEIHYVSLESREVYHHGGWLVDFGTFAETFSLDGEKRRHAVEGNYAATLERDADGDWKVKRFMALPSTSPPEPMQRVPEASAEQAN